MRPILMIFLLIPSAGWGAAQVAPVCPLVGAGLIQTDGLLDDWPPGGDVRKAAPDRRDAGLAVRCAYDTTTLYLSIDVTDERLIRARGKPEDRLVVGLGTGKLELLPSSGELELAWRWLDRKQGAPVEVADSLQRAGWSVELAVPIALIPGGQQGAPSVQATVELTDVDLATAGRVEDVVATGPLVLTFEAAARNLKAFLDEVRARPADVRLDEIAELDGEPGVERVVLAGKHLGVLSSEGFTFLALPVASAEDLRGVRVTDLGGAGKSSVLVHYVEHGGVGSREVLAIWALRGGGFSRIFAHEVAKQLGSHRMTNGWELLPRRGKRARGLELVFRVGQVSGFTAESWRETPASDMAPILLPWGDRPSEVWFFDHDEVSGGGPETQVHDRAR